MTRKGMKGSTAKEICEKSFMWNLDIFMNKPRIF